MDTPTREMVAGLIDDPELAIHRILSKQCVNRNSIAG
jgi:hypothetical protein